MTEKLWGSTGVVCRRKRPQYRSKRPLLHYKTIGEAPSHSFITQSAMGRNLCTKLIILNLPVLILSKPKYHYNKGSSSDNSLNQSDMEVLNSEFGVERKFEDSEPKINQENNFYALQRKVLVDQHKKTRNLRKSLKARHHRNLR